MTEGQQLLAEYAERGSETAFRELVTRYVDLVHSAAMRLVDGDPHLAEDVTQTVFADLAKLARSLSCDVMLGGWLHRHTCFVASKILRGERRRRERERQAVEMNSLEQQDHSAANLAQIAPILDDAINQLGAEDRTAILLRFFEQHDFQSVGAVLGSNEEAARKRVNRALDKLEVMLKRRGVAFSATALATALSTQAVTAAPAGLAVTISAAALTGTAASAGTTLTILKIMSMTKLQIGIVSALVVAGVAIPLVMQQQTRTQLTTANETIQKRDVQIAQLAAENERLSNLVARAGGASASPSNNTVSRDLLKARGEASRLKQENIALASSRTNAPSALSGLTANPETLKLIRDQQKAGMGMIYKDFAKRVKLSSEDGEKLANVLADHVMDNIQLITELLRDGKSTDEMRTAFAAQDVAVAEKLQVLLSPEAFEEYKDYTKSIASYLTAEQFKPKLSGDASAMDAKSKLIYQAMLEETQTALAAAGLPADYQTVPTMNFINIASETAGEKNLKLLDDIYARVLTRTSAFLSEDEIRKFGEFRTVAINNNRAGLLINRKLMMPGGR
jgi:RNA polymerase sigma factor (sigma-70 family)